mmetsp:Transcript_94314/g.270454  ORF Transcript_94314/g.270454 Transcript_94314/m.270454 type:complete len:370 (+) Transcript_94314:263-1372(+)
MRPPSPPPCELHRPGPITEPLLSECCRQRLSRECCAPTCTPHPRSQLCGRSFLDRFRCPHQFRVQLRCPCRTGPAPPGMHGAQMEWLLWDRLPLLRRHLQRDRPTLRRRPTSSRRPCCRHRRGLGRRRCRGRGRSSCTPAWSLATRSAHRCLPRGPGWPRCRSWAPWPRPATRWAARAGFWVGRLLRSPCAPAPRWPSSAPRPPSPLLRRPWPCPRDWRGRARRCPVFSSGACRWRCPRPSPEQPPQDRFSCCSLRQPRPGLPPSARRRRRRRPPLPPPPPPPLPPPPPASSPRRPTLRRPSTTAGCGHLPFRPNPTLCAAHDPRRRVWPPRVQQVTPVAVACLAAATLGAHALPTRLQVPEPVSTLDC